MKNDLIKLQNQLKLKKIDIYLIPQSDFKIAFCHACMFCCFATG